MLPVGWTGWIAHESIAMRGDQKADRPWARLRPDAQRLVLWVPRSSKAPREGLRWATESPAGELPGLDRAGCFVVSHYVRTEADFTPGGRVCGVLSEARVDEILRKLEDYYWDPVHG